MKPPCKKNGQPCSLRHPGCQSKCPDMKVAQLMNALDLEERKRLQDKQDTIAESVERMRRKRK